MINTKLINSKRIQTKKYFGFNLEAIVISGLEINDTIKFMRNFCNKAKFVN